MTVSRVFTGAFVRSARGALKSSKLVREFVTTPFNTLSKADVEFLKGTEKVLLTQLELAPKAIKGMGQVVFGGEKFAAKKANILKFAETTGDRKLYRQISKTNDPEELYKICSDYNMKLVNNLQTEYKNLLNLTNGKTTLALEQECTKLTEDRVSKVLGLYKSIGEKSTIPEVLKIEQELMQKYGMKHVNLQNDLNRGEEILKVVKLLKEKGYPIPDNVIVSDLHMATGELMRINGQNTMVLQSTKFAEKMGEAVNNLKFVTDVAKKVGMKAYDPYQSRILPLYQSGLGQMSTNLPEHIVMHECLHGNHPRLLAFMAGKIPAQYKPVIPKISLYTNINCNKAEILTELETEFALTGKLSPEKMELFKTFKNARYNAIG